MERVFLLGRAAFFWGVLGLGSYALGASENTKAPVAVQATEKDLQSDAERDFQRAKGLLDQGKESEALVSLTDFLRRYPTDNLADDSQFLVGEVWFRRRKFDEALNEFKKVPKINGGTGDRIADAGVRMGECWQELGNAERARIEWEAVMRRFPQSEAAHKAATLVAGVKSQ